MTDTLTCRSCKREKLLHELVPNKRTASGYSRICLSCFRERRAAMNKPPPGEITLTGSAYWLAQPMGAPVPGAM